MVFWRLSASLKEHILQRLIVERLREGHLTSAALSKNFESRSNHCHSTIVLLRRKWVLGEIEECIVGKVSEWPCHSVKWGNYVGKLVSSNAFCSSGWTTLVGNTLTDHKTRWWWRTSTSTTPISICIGIPVKTTLCRSWDLVQSVLPWKIQAGPHQLLLLFTPFTDSKSKDTYDVNTSKLEWPSNAMQDSITSMYHIPYHTGIWKTVWQTTRVIVRAGSLDSVIKFKFLAIER